MVRFSTGQVIYALGTTNSRDSFTRRKNASTPKKDENYSRACTFHKRFHNFKTSILKNKDYISSKMINYEFHSFEASILINNLKRLKIVPKIPFPTCCSTNQSKLHHHVLFSRFFMKLALLWMHLSSIESFVLQLHKAFSVPTNLLPSCRKWFQLFLHSTLLLYVELHVVPIYEV